MSGIESTRNGPGHRTPASPLGSQSAGHDAGPDGSRLSALGLAIRYINRKLGRLNAFIVICILVGFAAAYAFAVSAALHHGFTGGFSTTDAAITLATTIAVSCPLGVLFVLTVRALDRSKNRLKELRDEAAARSEAKSHFLANMSHELQTPLNAVLGFSEVMAKELYGPLGDPRYAEYAEDIHEGGQHLLGIVRDLLNLSKIEAGAFEIDEEEINIRLCVDGSLRMVAPQIKRAKLKIAASGADCPFALRADKRLVRQMLLNLLSNAIKFTPKGGSVDVQVVRKRNNWLTVSVSDTGSGIAPDDIPKVLEPFGRVDGNKFHKAAGTGLGLTLVKSMMQLHGGFLQLESVRGEGTTVSLNFPPPRVVATDRLESELQSSSGWRA